MARLLRLRMGAVLMSVLLSPLVMIGLATGQDAGAAIGPAGTVALDAPAAENGAQATALVDGFRSARFGMDQEAVLAAIEADFGIAAADVEIGENATERTRVLSIIVPDVLAGGGIAEVAYVLGYRSQTLIQIGIAWGGSVDPSLDGTQLYANGEVLASHFMTAGYDPASVRTGLISDSGLIMFSGVDSAGHSTLLVLQGIFQVQPDGSQVLIPTELALRYAADLENPDIFRIEPGQF